MIHPPKHETFDLAARTNTDPKGIVRAVDEYTVQPWGLYLARPTPGRPNSITSSRGCCRRLGLRATVFHFNPGHERDHDYYLDVGEYTPGPPCGVPKTSTWTSRCVPGWRRNWPTSTSC